MLGLVTKGMLAVRAAGGEAAYTIKEVQALTKVIIDSLLSRFTISRPQTQAVISPDVSLAYVPPLIPTGVQIDQPGVQATSDTISAKSTIDNPSVKESVTNLTVISHWWYED
jgi:hypothetical protein